MLPIPKAPTLAALLREQAEARGASVVYRYLAAGELETRSITFAELELAARGVAATLQERATFCDRALILAEDSIEFIRAFMGCQLAGVIAVPVSPPFPSQRGRRVETLRAIARDCGARIILSGWPREFQGRVESVAPEMADLWWIDTAEVPTEAAAEFRPQRVGSNDVTFLQYTSGSTSMPKGVVVTHDMVMHNEAFIKQALAFCEDDIMVSWLPLFHDMGLIGVVLPALYSGSEAVFMPPSVFARQPLQWLRTISRYRATISAAPDSAYRMCVERIAPQERAELDLRSWRLAANGSEPVSKSTLDAFVEAFGPCGFDKTSWFPTYGLAECTLMATAPKAAAGATALSVRSQALRERRVVLGDDRTLVGCGEASQRRIELVDAATCRRVEAGAVGEIWIAGPDVARRYWDRAEESERVFGAMIADSGEGPFLRSGDLGFVHEGDLYVTGRLKDVIIVGGRNHYPHDIEATAVSVNGSLVTGGCAAFSVELERDAGESVVIVAEVQGARSRPGVDVEEVAARIRSAVASDHGIAVADVVLVDRKSVPKTSSGKVQRAACRAAFERGELSRAQTYTLNGDVLAQPSPAERTRTLRRLLVEQIEIVLRTPPGTVDTTASFRDLGLDSLMTAELRDRIEVAIGERMSPAMFFAHPTTEQLVERLLERLAPATSPDDTSAAPEHREELAAGDEHELATVLAEEIKTVERVVER